MNPCQNCGKMNTPETNFCRFCGTKFVLYQPVTENPYDYSAPIPYAWKTDEFQTQNEARKTSPPDQFRRQAGQLNQATQNYSPVPLANQYGQPLATRPHFAVDGNYRCPRCRSSYLPIFERRISSAGWVVFSALLITTIIFFWIGLLMKEDVAICPTCRAKVS